MKRNIPINHYFVFQILAIPILYLTSCSRNQKVMETTYNNEKVVVSSVEVKGFSTNSITYSVKLGNRKKIPFDYTTIDLYDRPYSNDIFANTPHQFFSDTPVYKNEIDFERKINPTLLYLSPQKYTREEFTAYTNFFKNKWPEIVSAINKDWSYIDFQIIGIAYDNHENFVQYFTGNYNQKPYYFEISPDGQILFHPGVPPDNTGIEGTGLASKVQMPGKIIVFKDTSLFTPKKLQDFKDKKGKTLADYFRIEFEIR